MKKRTSDPLHLNRETLRPLTDRRLAAIGGGTDDIPICPPPRTGPKFPPNPC